MGIIVNGNSLSPTFVTFLRYILTMISGLFVARGFVTDDTATQIVAGLVGLISTVVGAYLAYRNNEQKKVLAEIAPNHVATVK